MSVVVITPPTPVVTIEEMERHLADLPDEDRDYVGLLIAAATAWIDGPAGWLRRAIGVQLLEARYSGFRCDPLRLPIPPVFEIASVEYEDIDGAAQMVDPDDYELREDEVGSAWGKHWPSTRAYHGRVDAVRIRYWAGYGKRSAGDPSVWVNEAPAPIKVAIMMLVAQWYNTRENVITGTITSEMPFAVDALLQPFRVYR